MWRRDDTEAEALMLIILCRALDAEHGALLSIWSEVWCRLRRPISSTGGAKIKQIQFVWEVYS